MNLRDAVRDHQNGVIDQCEIIPIGKQFAMSFFNKAKKEEVWLEKQRDGRRLFKTIDTAALAARKIGFDELRLVLTADNA